MATTPEKPKKPISAKEARHRERKRARKAGAPHILRKDRPQNRPQHTPTAESRAAVQALHGGGHTTAGIAGYLTHMMAMPVSADQVKKYYKPEIAIGKMHQQLVVSQLFYRKCAGAPAQYDKAGNMLRAEVKTETVAQIFWLKAQAGWRDHQTFTIDPNQKPIPVSISSLTDKQLDEFIDRVRGKTQAQRVEPKALPRPTGEIKIK